ncbi:hypothetical protein [Kribbella sandramycini]|nr:hypothetical protein [Kribbella sandramycini]
MTQTDSQLVDVLSFSGTAIAIVVSFWAAGRQAPPAPEVPALSAQLAIRSERQRLRDANANQLNEGPLTVSWVAGPSELMDRDARAVPRRRLTGDSEGIIEQLLRVPNRRWVVLGDGGAGKSALLLLLTKRLLADPAAVRGRVPVIVPLAAWEAESTVEDFLTTYVTEQFAGLAFAPKANRAEELRDFVRNHMLPLFDGLDELSVERHASVLKELSEEDADFPFVLTSRTQAYADAVAARRPLAGAAVVQLKPLSSGQILKYLQEAPKCAVDDWRQLLQRDKPVARALDTPLMVWLAAVAYAETPRALVGPDRHGDALDRSGPDDAVAERIRDRLLDGLIRARFDGHKRWGMQRWTAAQAEKWLTNLAIEVERRRAAPDPENQAQDIEGRIAWWRLADSAEPVVGQLTALAALLTTGFGVGIGVGYLFGPVWGAWCGLVLGVLIGVRAARSRLKPTTVEFRLSLDLFPIGLAGGLFVGLIGGAAVFVLDHDLSAVWAFVGFGLPLGAVYGLTSPVNVEKAVSPAIVLERERIFVLAFVLAYGLACGTAGWIISGPLFALAIGVTAGLSGGLFNGLPWAVIHWVLRTKGVDPDAGAVAWFRFLLAKLTWLRGSRLPWRLLTFLEDARRRGILQQVGATYRFRHAGLSRRLVVQASKSSTSQVLTTRSGEMSQASARSQP